MTLGSFLYTRCGFSCKSSLYRLVITALICQPRQQLFHLILLCIDIGRYSECTTAGRNEYPLGLQSFAYIQHCLWSQFGFELVSSWPQTKDMPRSGPRSSCEPHLHCSFQYLVVYRCDLGLYPFYIVIPGHNFQRRAKHRKQYRIWSAASIQPPSSLHKIFTITTSILYSSTLQFVHSDIKERILVAQPRSVVLVKRQPCVVVPGMHVTKRTSVRSQEPLVDEHATKSASISLTLNGIAPIDCVASTTNDTYRLGSRQSAHLQRGRRHGKSFAVIYAWMARV